MGGILIKEIKIYSTNWCWTETQTWYAQ